MKQKINLSALSRAAFVGQIDNTISQTLGGLRTGHRILPTKSITPTSGYVFLTKPQLNLSSSNLIRHRPLFPLLTADADSLAAWIRGTLDPRWARIGSTGGDASFNRGSLTGEDEVAAARQYEASHISRKDTLSRFTSQVDAFSPFINVVTNRIVSVNGFPDIDSPTFTGAPSRIGASLQLIDGVDNLNMPVDLTLTLQDLTGSPIYNMFRILSLYPFQVYSGKLQRYPDFIIEDSIDYNVRLYRLIMAPDGETISSIASTCPGFIQAVAAGSRYDYNLDNPTNQDNTVSFRFMFSGVIYEDPILVDDFNMTVAYANRDMLDSRRSSVYTRIPRAELEHFSYERVYPRINPSTFKLEWYILTDTYKVLKAMLESGAVTGTPAAPVSNGTINV